MNAQNGGFFYSREQLDKILASVFSKGSDPSRNLEVGLTYHAQLVSHDIVPATKASVENRKVSPFLTLESIYGDWPATTTRFSPEKTGFLDSCGFFQYETQSNGVQGYDFKRKYFGGAHIAITPEPRNDENFIVSQLAVFWMRLHNHLLRSFASGDPLKAKELTIKTFQLITIEHFLRHVLSSEVYEHYFIDNSRNYIVEKMTRVPKFFSNASFRFGHSMVRNNYTLRFGSRGNEVSLKTIFQKNHILNKKHVIDWGKFFTGNLRAKDMFAFKINSFFSSGMAEIGASAVNILMRNLEAGSNIKPATGIKHWMSLINKIPIKEQEKLGVINSRSMVSTINTAFENIDGVEVDNLPLWFYILVEASSQNQGEKLGTVGSILNAEVLKASIAQAQVSVYQQNQYNFQCALENMGSWGDQIRSLIQDDSIKTFSMHHLTNHMRSV